MAFELLNKLKLVEKITNNVQTYWASEKKPYLLSKIGFLDNGIISRSCRTLGMSLAEFIREELQGVLRLVVHSDDTAMIGAVPDNEETGLISDFDPLFHSEGNRPGARLERFFPVYWAAFKKPISTGMSRSLMIGPKPTFKDIADPQEIPLTAKLINTDFISSDETTIVENIKKWSTANDVDYRTMLMGGQINKTKHTDKHYANTVLDDLLSHLNHDDLMRISIPLDIVKKLNAKKN